MIFKLIGFYMHIHDYYPKDESKFSKDEMFCLSVLEYLYNDLEDDKHGGYAYAYGVPVSDVKKDVYELLKHYNCENSDILINAFDDDFSGEEKWSLFYDVIDILFDKWYNKNEK